MIIETVTSDSGLSIILLDQTRHYFGGYFHVKVLVYCDISLEQRYFENDADYGSAVKKMGTTVRFERVLDKMAVPESEIDSVRSQLIQAFHDTSEAYLSTPDFAPRFVRSEFLKHVKKTSQIQSSRV